MPGRGERAAHTSVEGHEFAVEEGEEAGLRPLGLPYRAARATGLARTPRTPRWRRPPLRRDQRAGRRVRRLRGVVEEQLVEAVEDVGDAVALAGEQPQPGPGEADHHGGLGPLALDVADGEAPAAGAGREEVVEVSAGPALVAGLVDEGA